MSQYNDVDAVCPFYRRSDDYGRKIICEGIMDGCTVSIRFETSTDYNIHRKCFCNRKFKNCELYTMIAKKYEEDD